MIAEEKEYRQYDMPKRLNKTYRTIMRRVSELESNGLIRLARKEPSEKRGKKAKVYMLTIKGVLTYLSSVSIEPIKLFVIGMESKEEVKKRVVEDIHRYFDEAGKLSDFLQFYGEKLDFAIFKEIQWLLQSFQIKTENLALTIILEAAKQTVSNFSTYNGLSKFAEHQKKERDRLKKEIREIQKIPISLRRIEISSWFGSKSEPEWVEKKEIDFSVEVKNRYNYAEETLRGARENENSGWKTFFIERFFSTIGRFSKKEKRPNAVLYKELSEFLHIKKMNEIAPLERTLELFSSNSAIKEIDEKDE